MKSQNRTSLRTSTLGMTALAILLMALPGFARLDGRGRPSPDNSQQGDLNERAE